ncbi:MAG: (2Fe-2S)-binding protein [Fervidicoccaceae archaeon]
MSGNPKLPSREIGGENEEKHVDGEFLIVAGEGAAVRFANNIEERSQARVLFLPQKPVDMLEKEAGEKVNSEIEVINASYLGTFEDGVYAINREKRRIYRLNIHKIVFFTGLRDAFPVFENNDIPGIVSAQLAIQLINNYSALERVKRVAVIVNENRGLKEAEELSRKKEVNILVTGAFKNNELSRELGAIPVEELEAVGYQRLEKIKILHPQKEIIEVDLLVSAIKAVPEIEPALQFGGELKYSQRLGAITVSTNMGKIEGTEGVYLLGSASGTPEDKLLEEVDLFSKLLVKEELSASEEKKIHEIQSSKKLEPLDVTEIREAPDFLLTRSYGGWKFVCPCQDVTLEDVLRAYDMGYKDIERIKRFTALGTGSCQGRICRFSVALLLSFLRGIPLGSLGSFRQRVPIEPIEIGFLS